MMIHSRNRLSIIHLLILMGIASVIRIVEAEVYSSTAAASNSNQQHQTPKEHLTPPPQRQSIRQYIQSNLLPHRVQEPSWIQRIARFFGFDYGRKQYPPPPTPVNTQSPVKFPNTERSSTDQNNNQQYNTYTANYQANNGNGGPYPNSNNPSQYGSQYNWNPSNFNNYPNSQWNSGQNAVQDGNQQFKIPASNLQQNPQYQNNQMNGQFNQNQNNGQFNQNQQINSQNNQQNGPQGPPPYPNTHQSNQPPPATNYQFQPSQQFQPSYGPYGQQQQTQPVQGPSSNSHYLPANTAPSLPQIITPPPTPPVNTYLPSRSPDSGRQLDISYVPCNKSPWIPMYNGREIVDRPEKFLDSTYLGAAYNNPGSNKLFPPSPPRQEATQIVKISPGTNTWAHQVSSNFIVGSPSGFYTTPSSNRVVTSPEYLPPPGHLPIQQQHHPLVPIPIPNLSVTAIPPLYDYRPFGSALHYSNGQQSGASGTSGGGVTNIIIGTNVGHPNAPTNGFNGNSNLKIVSNGVGGPTNAPVISHGHGYNYPKPNQIPNLLPAITNSHAGYQYPKPNIIPELLGARSNGKEDPKSQVESVQTVQFSTAMEPKDMDMPQQQPRMPPGSIQQQEDQMGLTVQPIVVTNQKREEKLTDSYTAASSHNYTIQEDNVRELQDLPINYVTEPPNYILDDETSLGDNFDIDQVVQPDNDRDAQPLIKKDPNTPKDLLDSPIFYLKGSPQPFTIDPTSLPRQPYQPDAHLSHTPATRPDWINASPFREPASASTSSTPLSFHDSSGNNAYGMAPPPPPMAVDSINLITKRPKQIQIIIPYTTNNRPQPFRALDDSAMRGEVRVNNDNYEKWANINQELHEEEESKIITATEPSNPRKTTKYLTKVLASSIRDLLNNERRRDPSNKSPFDILTLQKNIDDWTEQEFSVEPHKASTISLAGKSKSIPDDYLTTTTPSMERDFDATTTTRWYDDEATETPPIEGELQNDQHVADNRIVQVHENNNEVLSSDNGLQEDGDYWKKFKLAISPLTHEQFYVVTPQPWNERLVFNNADGIKVEEEHQSSYKSPRLVPVKQNQMEGGASYVLGLTLSQSVNNLQADRAAPKKPHTPELLGKLSHEEIHSFTKRITIVTASPKGKRFETS